ncbi:molybdenum ABC transporter ATP-binding protein [Gemmobacter serpentinus]|uniref:molybdenum ABC transporter ATP-binding protein n=1 Tax=Gemmobacter serpentinus TaxID=2652247 RepID=UPI00124BFF18|nr:molybdenum ABC transporter ATP-binding protein [Gemmobacter serpentinus]
MTLTFQMRHTFPALVLDVAFAAPRGITVLFGRSGCGKTTVVQAVAGLLRPDEGRIVADDTVLLDSALGINLPPHQRRLGYVFQDARLFPHLTVHQNLRYGRWFTRKHAMAQVMDETEIIEILGIGPLLSRRPGSLSGGEKQRVAIGRAILGNPRLLLMDEPLAALDTARKAEILPCLEQLRDELGLTILYVSHSMSEVARLADNVVVLEDGLVRATGPAEQVLTDPAAGFAADEAGAILDARMIGREDDGMARLETLAGALWLPDLRADPGAVLRLRIPARDVMLARTRPEGISALNVLEAEVIDLHPDGAAMMMVRLRAGGAVLLASLTRRSAAALDLVPGQRVHAIVKSASLLRERA